MNKHLVRDWKADYERHNRLEIAERQRATFEERLNALNRIVQFARQLRLDARDDETERVRQRWRTIRERYGK